MYDPRLQQPLPYPPQPEAYYPPRPPRPPITKPYSDSALYWLIGIYAMFWVFCIAGRDTPIGFDLGVCICMGVLASVLILDARGLISLQSGKRLRLGSVVLLSVLAVALSAIWLGAYFIVTFIAYQRPPLRFAPVRRKATLALGIGAATAFIIFSMMASGTMAAPHPMETTPTMVVQIQATDTVIALAAVHSAKASPTQPASIQPVQIAATPTPVPVRQAQPTQAAQTSQPAAPKPTPVHTGVNGNPWGYDFSPGNLIYTPPATFCQHFTCVSTFWKDTSGYVVECNDTHYSHSGGVKGACSRNGGIAHILYSH